MSSNSTNCVGGMAFFPGGGGARSGSSFMLHSPSADDNEHHLHHPPPSSLSSFLPSCAPPDHFHGMAPMLGKRSMSFTGMDMCEETNANYNTMNHHNNNNNNSNGIGIGIDDQELSDDGSQLGPGEKKRRLNMEQVRTLEKNFELGNKLEPERKMQLAKALGLQPRQIAIWFQNRRARWKTKQLEKDYESLKRQFDALKADNEALQALNHKLQAEIITMKGREPTESINLNKDTEGSSSNRSDNSSDIKLDISTTATATESPLDLSARMALFPPSSIKPNGPPAHLFHSPPPARPIKEEGGGGSFNNMFCGMDDQAGFWPWLEQQHFN